MPKTYIPDASAMAEAVSIISRMGYRLDEVKDLKNEAWQAVINACPNKAVKDCARA